MSSANGTSDVAAKRRKVSTTESTSSMSSSKDDQQQQTPQTPARTSRRIAGKERSYSHKFGYGEDEAILLLDEEKRKASPRKPSNTDSKEEAKPEPKKKAQNRNDTSNAESSTSSSRSNKKAEAKPKRNKSSESLSEKSDNEKNDRGSSNVDEQKSTENIIDDQVNSEPEPGESTKTKDTKPVVEEAPSLIEANAEKKVDIANELPPILTKADVNDNEETETTVPKAETTSKRKNASRAMKASDTPNPPVRRTRQTVNEETQKEVKVEVAPAKPETPKTNDTSFKASLPAKKRPIEPKHRQADTHAPSSVSTGRALASVNYVGSVPQQYANATKDLIEELKSNKQEQATIIDEYRRNKDEQQRVIDDLRKHRELQEKLIEDLRQSRNEKLAEVEKLRAQQRASSILFHREREEPLSRYDDMSGHGSSDNEDFGSAEDIRMKETALPAKSPLTFDGVLANVMEYTSATDLVNCRLVNQQWDKIASSAYKKNGIVTLKYGVSDFMNVVQTSSTLFPMTAFNLFLTDTFVKDINTELFVRRYSTYIRKLKVTLEYFYTDVIPITHVTQFLPPHTPNLEHLVIKLPCKYLSMPLNPKDEEDYGTFLHGRPTKLKVLKVVCQCTPIPHEDPVISDTHFQRGLLVELLENSPNLTTFEFKSGRFDTNRTLLRRVVELLNRVNLPRLQHLSLRGLELQDLDAPGFLPTYNLRSLHLNAVAWEKVEAIWIQHQPTLEAVTIGRVNENLDLNTTALANYKFTSLKELVIHPQIEDPSILSSFSNIFPNLKKLELHDPDESTVINIWKYLSGLEELVLDYSREVGENEKYKILHLDSLLSGVSINNCELILKKIMNKGLPQNVDFGLAERFNLEPSVQSMTKLRKLVITSSAKSIPFRITEVGLVLVLLRMKSLTSITINPCVLMKDTIKQLIGRISPAIYLNITSPEKEDDYESAKIALLL